MAENSMKHQNDTMEQQTKRIKYTKESIITDMASSLEHIADSLKSIGESYNDILRINTAVVTHLRDVERRKKEINLSIEDRNLHLSESSDGL